MDNGRMRALAHRLVLTREARSREVIRRFLEKCKKPYLSWSGGKDSTVLLYLTLKEKPDIEVIYFDADSCLPDGWEYMMRLVDEWNLNFRVMKTRPILDVLAEYGIDHPGIDYRTMKATVYEPVKQLCSEGYDGSLIGIRAQESSGRRWGAKKYGELFWAKGYQMWECWPMLHWKTEELWLYIDHFRIPYHPAYDKTRFEPRERIRVSYWAGETNRQFGRYKWLEYYYPELFQKLVETCPEVKSFV